MICARLRLLKPIRYFSTASSCSNELMSMRNDFEFYKKEIKSLEKNKQISPDGIFCNNEVNLANINCYGFDYDYTLAQYSKELERYIYNEAKQILVSNMKYPERLMELEWNSNFAIRGLHFDVRNGLFMKVDANNNIQLDSVYRGRTRVPKTEILKLYNGTYIPKQMLMSQSSEMQTMSQLMDLFIVPEMNLISNIIQFFIENEIDFDPAYLHEDISKAVRWIHKSGRIHLEISNNPEKYIQTNTGLMDLLAILKKHDKKTFIITNSDFNFVNRGMIYLTQCKKWANYFNIIITTAKKPDFFLSTKKPFRQIVQGQSTWSRVSGFHVDGIYKEGNLQDFMKYTGWQAKEIVYFGDHIYADLADVATTQGWTTGAIIREVSDEILVLNSMNYQQSVRALLLLEKLLYKYQHVKSADAQAQLQYWSKLRHRLRFRTKNLFNPYFGSMFRTYHNPTNFCQRISLYADLYTSSVNNLMKYPINHRFYPKRAVLAHEPHI